MKLYVRGYTFMILFKSLYKSVNRSLPLNSSLGVQSQAEIVTKICIHDFTVFNPISHFTIRASCTNGHTTIKF